MKQYIYFWLCLVLCNIPITACGNISQQTVKPATSKQFVPDQRFASIDTLAEFMIEGLWESTTPEKLLARFKEESLAIKSYWLLNHKGSHADNMTDVVISDLGKLAESLSEGSTFDMVESGEIEAVVSRYLMAKDYSERYQDNPLYIDEMRDWLALESELNDYGASWAYLQNWGGSLSRLIASGFTSMNAACRQKSYCQLHRGGQFTKCQTSLNEVCAKFRQSASLIPSQDEYLMEEQGYEQMISQTIQSGEKVLSLFNKWLASNQKLCKSEGIPESHTAAFVEDLVNNIYSAMN